MEKQRKRRPWKWLFGIAAAAVLLLAAAAVTVFYVNRFRVSIQLKGEPEILVQYGQPYTDPGVEVRLQGTLFWKEGIVPEDAAVTVQNAVREDATGKYTVTYSVDYHGMHAREQRVVRVIDTQCPQIILTEDPAGTLIPGTPYQEAGFRAVDNYDGDITDRVVRTEEYGRILYAVVDSSGNPAYAERQIPYHDPEAPKIQLTGGTEMAITTGTFYEEPGFTATDNVDGDLTQLVEVEGEVDWLHPGTYPITYTVSDSFENKTTVTRTVEVTAKPRPEAIWPQNKVIYLTFDDGPGPYTEGLLDVLDKYGVKATFFVTDSGYDEVMKDIVDRGHSIGIHTVSHNYAEIYASPENYFNDLFRMQEIIYENTGVKTTLMRFPGGSSNAVSRKTCEGLMTLLTEAVRDAGFQYFDWNVDSDDAGSAKKTQTVLDNVKEGVSQCRVAVVLQHDIRPYSVDAVEDIIVWGLNNGYTFEALTENSPGMHHSVFN